MFREHVRADPTCRQLREGGLTWAVIDREIRLAGLGRLVKRPLSSTKDLHAAEVTVALQWLQTARQTEAAKLTSFVANTAARLLPDRDPFADSPSAEPSQPAGNAYSRGA